ncbi:hypothetical protein [Solimonas terrae]|uniref:Uncharacterized protein n=1 Tax=Solimonas terrae TaxID=1396819 RepID=A0A6M2BM33_9GAMM|nr:hypothetical protein [Solimonas terrae]NGY03159.1 hypothetical protein [Solimonas terrae]
MNNKQAMAALVLATAAGLTIPAPARAFGASDVAGTWTIAARKLVYSAVMYTTLEKDGSCSQALKVSGMGMTKWAFDRCAWSLQKSELSIRIISSPTLPDQVGKTSVTTIRSLTPDALQTEDQKHEAQTWTRTAEWPTEFTKQFDDAYAAATKVD